METDIQKLLKLINYDDKNNLFNIAIISKKEFKKSNKTLHLTILLEKILPINQLEIIENLIIKSPIKLELSFVTNTINYEFEELWDYLCYIKANKAEIKGGFWYHLNPSTLKLKQNILIINVDNKLQVDLIKIHQDSYIHYLKKYGFNNIEISYNIVEQVVDYLAENEALKEAEIEKFKFNEMMRTNNKNNNTYDNNVKNNGKYRKYNLSSFNSEQSSHRIADLEYDQPGISLQGKVFKKSIIKTKTNKMIYNFWITDFSDSINLRYFSNEEVFELEKIKVQEYVLVYGDLRYDSFSREQILIIKKIKVIDEPKIELDDHQEKRVELHLHTKMSAMDGVNSITDYINRSGLWNHNAIAVTDHLNVQSFPEAQKAQTKFPELKVIYGVEMNMIDSNVKIVKNKIDSNFNDCKYVIFDIETTGLSCQYDEIIEFGATIVNGRNFELERIDFLIKPKKPVSIFTEQLTNISNEMLKDQPTIEQVAPKIKDLFQNAVLVAHNSDFDMGFIKQLWTTMNYGNLDNCVIDTLQLSRALHNDLRYHRLGTVARKYGIKYNEDIAHRGDYDAEILASVFSRMLNDLETQHHIKNISDINNIITEQFNYKLFTNHITILAKNELGLKKLFELVSLSHTKYFYNSPKILKSELENNRQNLLFGSSCVNGAVFEAAKNKSLEDLQNIISFYDYIEIQPLDVYMHLIQLKEITKERLIEIIKSIIKIATKLNKIIVATGDVHYLDPKDKIYRDVYINTKQIAGVLHPLFDRKGRINEYPNQHLRTTKEMLEAFSFLEDNELIKKIVIDNTNFIANQIDYLKPIKDKLFTPKIANVDQMLKRLCYENAKKIYGPQLPIIVSQRLERELDAIIKHEFAVIYWIAHKLVEQSLNDGYLVGSRGSVGSSLVATLTNITEVNPLVPHYICLKCHYTEFIDDENIRCGYDLPSKICLKCNDPLIGEGHDIPFETFLGFDGDKVPDIDLNFSGEYQTKAHNFTKKMFGENNVFRAGTISTVAAKTAFGYAKGYNELKNPNKNIRQAELERLAQGCEGVKRTTGQHPGGIIVIPQEYDVTDFTPYNYPADDINSSWKTTHFDFNSIHDNVLKLDILGHVDPTALRMLHDMTGFDPKKIPTSDPKVLSLFSSCQELNINSEDLVNEVTAAAGIPEFGTQFVREMLVQTRPTSFAELVQISGLSHGTDVWVNNAQNLIEKQNLKLKDVIGCRDDIMVYLIHRGLKKVDAFSIMEDVRKGKGIKPEYEKIMKEHNIPEWYIQSCKKIKYMFPKAHATAYVLMAWRIAWYKVYYPHEYYATYFSTRCAVFDIKTMVKGKEAIRERLIELKRFLTNNPKEISQKEKDLIPVLEVALEMYCRNIEFNNIDLALSKATQFFVNEIDGIKKIVPALTSVDGLGETAAFSVVKAREQYPIISLEDLQKRTSCTKTHIQIFIEIGALDQVAEVNQIGLKLF